MGFRSKKNRVHPSGNKKKQRRKERKQRRLARLVQRVNPFSCCIRDSDGKDGGHQESPIVDNFSFKEKQLKETSRKQLHLSVPSHGGSLREKATPAVTHHANTRYSKSPPNPSRASTAMSLVSRASSGVSLTPPAGLEVSSDEDDSLYPPKSSSRYFQPVEVTSMATSSRFKECRSQVPPQTHQSKEAKSFIITNYQPSSIGIQEDLMPHITSFPSINSHLHQRLPYCKMVQKAYTSLSNSEESFESAKEDTGAVGAGKEEDDESSDDFEDCFEQTKNTSRHLLPNDTDAVKPMMVYSDSNQKDINISEDPTGYETQDEEYHEGDPCTSPEKDVEYFPGEEHIFLPTIETSLRYIRGWLLPPNIQQRAIQPEPPFVLDDDKPIQSCTINHALLAISYYTSNLQSGLWFRGKQCPYFVEGMFRSAIKNGNTVHLENYDHKEEVSPVEAFTLLRTKYDACNLEWDTDNSTMINKPERSAEMQEEGHFTGLSMDIYCPTSNERSLAYHVSKLDVDAHEALMYTFKGDSMVFLPTGDGRILLMDQHSHDDMDGGAIIAVCPSSVVPIQDMLNDYHLEYHESNDREGFGVKFSYMC